MKLLKDILFIAALFLTLFRGPSFFWLGLAGWACVFLFILRRSDYVTRSLFFFSSFFHASGLVSNSLFSIKHLHVACLLAILAGWRRDQPLKTFREGFQRNQALWPVYGVLFLATLAGLFPFSLKAFKLSVNWMFVLFFTTYLLGLLNKKNNLLKESMPFFIGGIVIQCLISYFNLAVGKNWLEMSLINNNHLSLLLCFGLFYGLWLFLVEDKRESTYLLGVSLFLMFTTLGFSLSRTGWACFFLNFILFIGFTIFNRNTPRKQRMRILLFLGALLFLTDCCLMYPNFMERLISVEYLLTGKYVHIHGDFFARFRPELLEKVFSLSLPQMVFGRGFLHWITDIHSLYLVLFAASGILGLALFSGFILNLSVRLFFSIDRVVDWRERCFCLAAFCAVSSWALTSIMATLFLQFYIWLCVAVGLSVLKRTGETDDQ